MYQYFVKVVPTVYKKSNGVVCIQLIDYASQIWQIAWIHKCRYDETISSSLPLSCIPKQSLFLFMSLMP